MRAPLSVLTLALLVLRVDANHAHHPAPVNDLALVADFLYRCTNFHLLRPSAPPRSLCTGTRSARASDRRAKAPPPPVAGKDADEILSHLSGNVRQHLMLVFEFTRNIAFGSGSITVAITSMASSFGLPRRLLLFGFGPFRLRP
jgi:hypothetical protein